MKIVLGYLAQPKHVDKIRQCCADLNLAAEVQLCGDSDVPSAIGEADIFCGHIKAEVDWQQVVSAGQLKWIQSSAAGLDHCLVPEVIASDIVISSASGLFSQQVAETTMALLHGLLRRIHVFFPAQQRRVFQRQPTDDLADKTVGIVGFGGNGRVIASKLASYPSLEILATDCHPESNSMSSHRGLARVRAVYPPDQLDRLMEQSEIVIVTVGLTATTRSLIGADQLEAMKQGSYLINVGRGDVVDTLALIDSLNSGHLSGAGLDVVDPEPLPPDHPLWDCPNLLITPHIGAQAHRRFDAVTSLFCDNLERWVRGGKIVNLVDKQLGFPLPENRFDPLLAAS